MVNQGCLSLRTADNDSIGEQISAAITIYLPSLTVMFLVRTYRSSPPPGDDRREGKHDMALYKIEPPQCPRYHRHRGVLQYWFYVNRKIKRNRTATATQRFKVFCDI